MSQILSTPREYSCQQLGVCNCPAEDCSFVELSEPEPTPDSCNWEQIASYVLVSAVLVATVVFGAAMGAWAYFQFVRGL